MPETLSYLFQQSQGAAIDFDGRIVWPIFVEKVVQPAKKFMVKRLASTNSPVQGLRIKASKGTIEVDGQRYPDIVLWADTSPALVEIAVCSRNGCELKAWNVWKMDGIPQAWVGNAGMLIHRETGVATLECSSGTGGVDFTDLVVQIAACD